MTNQQFNLTYFLTAMLIAVIALGFVSTPIFAASAHFTGKPIIVKNTDGSLTAKAKIGGLPNLPTGAFLSSSGGAATLQCVNPGGNNPPPKITSFGALQGETVIVEPVKGKATVSPSIGPPPLPSASQICPDPSWAVTLLSITYYDVVFHVQQNSQDVLTYNFGNVGP